MMFPYEGSHWELIYKNNKQGQQYSTFLVHILMQVLH